MNMLLAAAGGSGMNTWGLGILILIYVLVIGFLGFRGFRGTHTHKDYLVAGRETHPFVMAMSYPKNSGSRRTTRYSICS